MKSAHDVNTSATVTRVPKPKMVMRSLRVPESLWEAAKAKADEQDLNVSDVVRELLANWVADDHEPPEQR